jgi:hypothetical protein
LPALFDLPLARFDDRLFREPLELPVFFGAMKPP